MICPMPPARPQQRYDHRLRELVQHTGDVTIATDLGVPPSTARGWLRTAPAVVVSLKVADMTELELRHEVLALRRRVHYHSDAPAEDGVALYCVLGVVVIPTDSVVAKEREHPVSVFGNPALITLGHLGPKNGLVHRRTKSLSARYVLVEVAFLEPKTINGLDKH